MESDECEQWMLESIRLYKDLHDFELQDPTRVIEWVGEKSICVAGYDCAKTNEILQLLVPQKLHTKENQGLCPERDLKVEHGGFSEHPVYSLKHIPETSVLVTSGPAVGSVQVWRIGAEDKDVIKPVSTIHSEAGTETWTKIATISSSAPCLIHGSQAGNTRVSEVESAKQIYSLGVTSRDPVSTISSLDSNTFFLCCSSGRQYMADVRQPQPAGEGTLDVSSSSNGHWCAAVRSTKQEARSAIASLSSEGHIIVTDTRDLSTPVKYARCRPSGPASAELFMCISWAPVLEDTISISGFDGTVQIYSAKSWDATMKERDPLFAHKGHSVIGVCEDGSVPRVTAHSWHPWKERTVLSAATDGSLHVWDWSDSNSELDS
ncbi:WD repeat-containing protein 73 [Spea bombifrons]|uniref:WD repeat-containing protein 73 n=1 Tax=Spea bombifrons TaxID=233779 RepID=UPI00234BDF37|nr:WD repeat-containing protein 73 [Spea bombifrons]